MEIPGSIPTYVINMRHRSDRHAHITREFAGRPEFAVEFVEASEHANGAIGLWRSICRIITMAGREQKEFVLICEDDHQFTAEYSSSYLFDCIAECMHRKGDVLLGGTSWFDSALPVSGNLHWVGKFSGAQFMIIFRKFYPGILGAPFGDKDNADYKIAAITSDKFFMTRPVSRQAYFGYSDITAKNGFEGRLDELFDKNAEGIRMLSDVAGYYMNSAGSIADAAPETDYTGLVLPVYVIMQPGACRENIIRRFSGKSEFRLHFIDTHQQGVNEQAGMWNATRQVIEQAMENDDDVIVICDKAHSFTLSYSKEFLFSNIVGAHYQGADLLIGGCRESYRTFPIARSRYWVAEVTSATFLIVYRKFFEKIVTEPFDEQAAPGALMNEMTFHKMLLYPFISVDGDLPTASGRVAKKMAELETAAAKYYWNKHPSAFGPFR